DGADAAGDAARVGLEVGDLVVDGRPVEDALVGRVALVERAVEARRLARAAGEVPGDVVGEAVDVARAAGAPGGALQRPAAEAGVEQRLAVLNAGRGARRVRRRRELGRLPGGLALRVQADGHDAARS